jgi:hypothetical protein
VDLRLNLVPCCAGGGFGVACDDCFSKCVIENVATVIQYRSIYNEVSEHDDSLMMVNKITPRINDENINNMNSIINPWS